MSESLNQKFEKLIQDASISAVDIGKLGVQVEHLDRRINGTLDAVQRYMSDGKSWRATVFVIAISVVMQIITFAYLFGSINERVNNAVRCLDQIMAEHQVLNREQRIMNEEFKEDLRRQLRIKDNNIKTLDIKKRK